MDNEIPPSLWEIARTLPPAGTVMAKRKRDAYVTVFKAMLQILYPRPTDEG